MKLIVYHKRENKTAGKAAGKPISRQIDEFARALKLRVYTWNVALIKAILLRLWIATNIRAQWNYPPLLRIVENLITVICHLFHF